MLYEPRKMVYGKKEKRTHLITTTFTVRKQQHFAFSPPFNGIAVKIVKLWRDRCMMLYFAFRWWLAFGLLPSATNLDADNFAPLALPPYHWRTVPATNVTPTGALSCDFVFAVAFFSLVNPSTS